MEFYPSHTPDVLGFDKIKRLLADACFGPNAVKRLMNLSPSTKADIIERSMSEIEETLYCNDEKGAFPLATYTDITESLERLQIVDYVLNSDQIIQIRNILTIYAGLRSFFDEALAEHVPLLHKRVFIPDKVGEELQEINRVFDKDGSIRSDASPELASIFRQIRSKQGELDRTFRKLADRFRGQGWLADSIESFKSGRRVLSVPAEHKRKIKGIIHDESSSGKTVFLEPAEVSEINNELFDLEQEKKREVYKILRGLCNYLTGSLANIELVFDTVVFFDVLSSKAGLARLLDAVKPKILSRPVLNIKEGRHPLLLLKNKNTDEIVVPHDLTLHPPNRVLVLSGPNAGGKSVLLKAMGLNQVMAQSGLLIPCDSDSEVGVFQKLFVDIGDQQSIDNDLSTYSSHLTNMDQFLKHADEGTMVLIDEFGSGTDPKIGGAIAESILKTLNRKKVHGVITTHYSNLKIFAYREKGLVNGALSFDNSTLTPTYELRIGKPGSSFGFEIAEKVGLPMRVLKYARKRAGEGVRHVDELLVDLEREKQEVEEKLKAVNQQEIQLKRIRANYDQLQKDLDIKRKRLKIEQKQSLLRIQAKETARLEKLISDLKEQERIEEAREALKSLKVNRSEEIDAVSNIKKDLSAAEVERTGEPIEVGDHVRMRDGEVTGSVVDLDNGKARVQMGMLTLDVGVEELVKVKEPIKVNTRKSVQSDVEVGSFRDTLDIRGMRKADADEVLQQFLDKALLAGVQYVRILHGVGQGVLRTSVLDKIREYDQIKSWRHGTEEQGGDGVTYIEF